MNDWLREYRRQVNEFPRLDDAWFPQAIARARAGDENACKRILGSTLRLVLEVADEFASQWERTPLSEKVFSDLVETGNSFLRDYLARSVGDSAETFCSEVRTMLSMRMSQLLK